MHQSREHMESTMCSPQHEHVEHGCWNQKRTKISQVASVFPPQRFKITCLSVNLARCNLARIEMLFAAAILPLTWRYVYCIWLLYGSRAYYWLCINEGERVYRLQSHLNSDQYEWSQFRKSCLNYPRRKFNVRGLDETWQAILSS